MEKVFVYLVEAPRVGSGGCREGDRCQADVGSRGLPGMRDKERAVPLILGRVTGAHGAHAEAGWRARRTEEQYRPLRSPILLELYKARFLVREGVELIILTHAAA